MDKKVIVIANFKLNDGILLEEWEKYSHMINQVLAGEKGFISRDSANDEENNIYCVVKWENLEIQKAYKEKLDIMFKENPERAQEFARIVNLTTMNKKILQVL